VCIRYALIYPKLTLLLRSYGNFFNEAALGGCKELVVEGETGFLVNDKDVDSYTHHIEQLINDPQKCRSMGEAGKKRMQNEFSTKALAEKTEALYRTLLSQHRN
jgi:glycosyltransferase involved in cell wall biosynthesis